MYSLRITNSFLLCIRIRLIGALIPEPDPRFTFRIGRIGSTELVVIYLSCAELGSELASDLFLKTSRDAARADFNCSRRRLVGMMIRIGQLVLHTGQVGWYCWASGRIMILFAIFLLDFHRGGDLPTYYYYTDVIY